MNLGVSSSQFPSVFYFTSNSSGSTGQWENQSSNMQPRLGQGTRRTETGQWTYPLNFQWSLENPIYIDADEVTRVGLNPPAHALGQQEVGAVLRRPPPGTQQFADSPWHQQTVGVFGYTYPMINPQATETSRGQEAYGQPVQQDPAFPFEQIAGSGSYAYQDQGIQQEVMGGRMVRQAQQRPVFSSPLEAELYEILQSLPPLQRDKNGKYYTDEWLKTAINKGLPLRPETKHRHRVEPKKENILLINLIDEGRLTKRQDNKLHFKIEGKRYTDQLNIFGKNAINFRSDMRIQRQAVFEGEDDMQFDETIYLLLMKTHKLPLSHISNSKHKLATKVENDLIINLWETAKLHYLGGQWKCDLTTVEYTDEINKEIVKVKSKLSENQINSIIYRAKKRGIVFKTIKRKQPVSGSSEMGSAAEFLELSPHQLGTFGKGTAVYPSKKQKRRDVVFQDENPLSKISSSNHELVTETQDNLLINLGQTGKSNPGANNASDEKIQDYGDFLGFWKPTIEKQVVQTFVEENQAALPEMGLADIMRELNKMKAFSFYPENDSALFTAVEELLKEMGVRYGELAGNSVTTSALSEPPAKRARVDGVEIHVNASKEDDWWKKCDFDDFVGF